MVSWKIGNVRVTRVVELEAQWPGTELLPSATPEALAKEKLEMMDAMRMPFSENKVYAIGGRTLKHATCPLPMAALKGMEVAAGLGLKRDVLVSFDK